MLIFPEKMLSKLVEDYFAIYNVYPETWSCEANNPLALSEAFVCPEVVHVNNIMYGLLRLEIIGSHDIHILYTRMH